MKKDKREIGFYGWDCQNYEFSYPVDWLTHEVYFKQEEVKNFKSILNLNNFGKRIPSGYKNLLNFMLNQLCYCKNLNFDLNIIETRVPEDWILADNAKTNESSNYLIYEFLAFIADELNMSGFAAIEENFVKFKPESFIVNYLVTNPLAIFQLIQLNSININKKHSALSEIKSRIKLTVNSKRLFGFNKLKSFLTNKFTKLFNKRLKNRLFINDEFVYSYCDKTDIRVVEKIKSELEVRLNRPLDLIYSNHLCLFSVSDKHKNSQYSKSLVKPKNGGHVHFLVDRPANLFFLIDREKPVGIAINIFRFTRDDHTRWLWFFPLTAIPRCDTVSQPVINGEFDFKVHEEFQRINEYYAGDNLDYKCLNHLYLFSRNYQGNYNLTRIYGLIPLHIQAKVRLDYLCNFAEIAYYHSLINYRQAKDICSLIQFKFKDFYKFHFILDKIYRRVAKTMLEENESEPIETFPSIWFDFSLFDPVLLNNVGDVSMKLIWPMIPKNYNAIPNYFNDPIAILNNCLFVNELMCTPYILGKDFDLKLFKTVFSCKVSNLDNINKVFKL